MRAWSGLIRFATLLAPVAILLFWGGSYLLACAEYLANPGVPLRMSYKSPGGNLLITADSYVLNTKNGDLTVVKPRVVDPSGSVLFYADRIEALGLPLLGNETRRAVVTVRNAYATVLRKPDGNLDLFDYLPKQEGPSGNFPFAINLNKGKIKFVETTGSKRWVQNLDVFNILVDGVGDRWLGSGNATLENVGDLSLSIQNQPDAGIWIRGKTDRLEIAEVFRAFRETSDGKQTPELQDIDANSLVLMGPFEVFLPSKSPARLQATLVVEAEGFRYGKDYRADRVRYEGVVSADGAQGRVEASENGLAADFEGFINWRDALEIDGQLNAKAPSVASLPSMVRTQVPKNVAVKGPLAYAGRLAYRENPGWRLNGNVNAGSITAYQESISAPSVDVDYSDNRLALVAKKGSWRGAPIEGTVALDSKSQALTGSLKLSGINLTSLAQRFNIDRFSGSGDLDVLLTGTTSKPVAFIRAESQGSYSINPQLPTNSGRFSLAATLKDNRIRFDQAYIVTPAGSVSASGTYNLSNQAVNMVAVGSGIDLDRVDPGLEGIGRFKANIGGTLSKPKYTGTAELFGLTVQEQPIPIITTSFSGDLQRVMANDIKVVKGASQAQGQMSLQFKGMALAGDMQALGVQLSDFLGDEYLATIDLPDVRIAGTLSKPAFSANAKATEIVILGNKVDSAAAVISFKENLLQVDDFVARLGQGEIEGFLSYDVAKKDGQANFTAEKIALQNFVPPNLGASMTAELSGEAGLTFDGEGFKLGSGEGKLANVSVNETPLGGGDWKFSADGKQVTGDAFVGGLATSIDLTGMTYQLDSKRVGGNVWLRNAPVEDIYKISKPYLPAENTQLVTFLEQLSGRVGLSADLGGTLQNLDFSNGSFLAENLRIKTGEDQSQPIYRSGGTIQAAFDRAGKKWDLDSLTWTGNGPVGIDAKGTFTESGAMSIDGRIEDLDLSYLGIYNSTFANLVGKIDSDFRLTGTAKDPVLQASPVTDNKAVTFLPQLGSQSEKGVATPGIGTLTQIDDPSSDKPEDKIWVLANPLNFSFNELTISNWNKGIGGIEGQASIDFEGYGGNLNVNLPFRFPFDLVAGAPVSAQLVLNHREIKDIAQLATLFDPARSEGNVMGKIDVSGTKENLVTVGGVQFDASRLVLKEGGQEFQDVKANLQFSPRELSTSLDATSATGGSIQANAKANIPSLDEILRQFREGNLAEILNSPISGTITSRDLAAKLKLGTDGNAESTLKTDLTLAGTLKDPRIAGEVGLANSSITMPSEFPAAGDAGKLAINPSFDVRLRTNSPAKFKSSTAEIDMEGGGSIQGDLNALDANATLRVTKGVLRLPTTRVTLEPGGSIRPSFNLTNGVSDARLDVEIEGKTRVVAASRIGEGAQRYDITLDVRGDLLKDGGLALTATSDPSDLTQDEILALLGQVNLIEGIASGVQSGNPEAQIRDALIGIAVPYLLDPVTSKIAAAFTLDYLTLDINALDGATVYFAKTLGRNLTLQGSRQVSQINQNYPIKYDLRLAYQLRFGNRADRRRVNFILGLDEVRPWKIAVEYTFRF